MPLGHLQQTHGRGEGSASHRVKQRGLSLTEVLVVIGITSVLAALAVPVFANHAAKQRASDASKAFALALQTARSEAIKRSRVVAVCPSMNALATDAHCAAAPYESGWLVYVDNNRNGEHDRRDEVILRSDALLGEVSMSTSDLADGLRFNASGGSITPLGRPHTGTLNVRAGDVEHEVQVAASGRVTTERLR